MTRSVDVATLSAAARGALDVSVRTGAVRRSRRRVRSWWLHHRTRWGRLWRLTPFSRQFGFDRGLPVDRYYIESFLRAHAAHVRGRVLEIADSGYCRRFGQGRVTHVDVLHAERGNPNATLVGDLATGEGVPVGWFDCIIATQTLQYVYDIRGAVRTLHAALVPGGVLLCTIPGLSQISRYDAERWGEYWRLTAQCAQRLIGETFGGDNVEATAFGNVLTSIAFLHGLSAEELRSDELAYVDRDYELLVTVYARKPQ